MSDQAPPEFEPVLADAEPGAAPYGTETALGGQTRDQYRAGSPIYAEILKTIEFHRNDECRHGLASAQILREVFGTIARMAMPDGVVKRPNNRPAELREWPAGAIRQLAALCRVYAPDDVPDSITGHTADEVAAGLADALDPTPEPVEPVAEQPISPATTPEAIAAREASVAEFERQLLAERDPFASPAPIDTATIEMSHTRPWPGSIDVFSDPAPISAAEWDRARGLDDIPF